MVQFFLTDIRDWVNSKRFNLDICSVDCPLGYFLKVNLDMHNDYPLPGKKMKVRKEILELTNHRK